MTQNTPEVTHWARWTTLGVSDVAEWLSMVNDPDWDLIATAAHDWAHDGAWWDATDALMQAWADRVEAQIQADAAEWGIALLDDDPPAYRDLKPLETNPNLDEDFTRAVDHAIGTEIPDLDAQAAEIAAAIRATHCEEESCAVHPAN